MPNLLSKSLAEESRNPTQSFSTLEDENMASVLSVGEGVSKFLTNVRKVVWIRY